MSSFDALVAMAPVVAALERLGVVYYLGGSVASSAYGTARTTLDVDMIADLADEHVAPLVEALQAEYYIDAGMIADAVARKSCFNVIHLATMFKVDVFVVKDRSYDRMALTRIRPDTLDMEGSAVTCPLASPEDIVLSKLEWFRLGDEVSERQWLDVIGVLKVQGNALDRDYLDKWAGELGIADLLDRARKQSEI